MLTMCVYLLGWAFVKESHYFFQNVKLFIISSFGNLKPEYHKISSNLAKLSMRLYKCYTKYVNYIATNIRIVSLVILYNLLLTAFHHSCSHMLTNMWWQIFYFNFVAVAIQKITYHGYNSSQYVCNSIFWYIIW